MNHKVRDGGCGGMLRTLYVREQNFMSKTWRAVGTVCTVCAEVRVDLRRQDPLDGLSLRQVSEITGRSEALLRKHIQRGKLRATRVGWRLSVSVGDLRGYLAVESIFVDPGWRLPVPKQAAPGDGWEKA